MKIFCTVVFLTALFVSSELKISAASTLNESSVPETISFSYLFETIRTERNNLHFVDENLNPELFKPSVKDITMTVFWEGDSRTDQNEISQPPKKLADLYKASFVDVDHLRINISRPTSSIKIVSLALSGDTLQAIRRRELAQPDSYAEGETKIYILDAGGNDLATGRSASLAFDDFQYIANAQAAKGYTVYAATVCDGDVDSGSRAKIEAFNGLIRKNYPANRIVDFANASQLNDFNNSSYFLSDGIHYTDAGKLLKAKIVYAQLTKQIKPRSSTLK